MVIPDITPNYLENNLFVWIVLMEVQSKKIGKESPQHQKPGSQDQKLEVGVEVISTILKPAIE